MKKFFKKMAAVAAVTALNIGLGAMPVYADELQQDFNDEIIENEANYYICDELADENIDVEEIIEKVEIMYENGEISRELAEDMISIWYSSPNSARTITATAKDFFVATPIFSGQTIKNGVEFGFTFPNNISGGYEITTFESSISDMTHLTHIGNAVPSLTMNNVCAELLIIPGDTRIWYNAEIVNNFNATSNYGNLFTFPITVKNSSGTEIGGQLGYNIVRNNISVRKTGINLNNISGYNYVGSLGDIDNDGDVDIDDKQILLSYELNEYTFTNSMQYATADITEDGIVDIGDYSKLFNYVNGTYTSLR